MIQGITNSLYKFIPVIKRARGYRLYDNNGKRYIDLYQQNGHALLGHRAFSLTTILKNIISKGLIFDLPSIYASRLIKAVKELIPGIQSVFIAGSIEQGLKSLSAIGEMSLSQHDIYDPFLENKRGKIAVWRPFSGITYEDEQILLPILPFSMGGSPIVICFRKKLMNLESVPLLSPFILAGTVRAVYDLNKYIFPEWFNNNLLKNTGKWDQRGLYIIPKMEEKEYEVEFKRFLSKGVLLSPHYPQPSILPAELSSGELQNLLQLFNRELNIK
ncbi:MAG: hypothetical protein OQK82_03085 [Candidatus Pacearchaeota archaeon]|nr:hypothetical protein [Candidatus Pacearchaeota archaeon]